MLLVLANAEMAGSSNNTLWMVLASMAGLLATGALSIVPIAIARHKRKAVEALAAVTILWGLLLAASLLNLIQQQFHWAEERDRLLRTGYYDPQSAPGAPAWPWWFWAALAGVYALLLFTAWRGLKRPVTAPPRTAEPPSRRRAP